MKIILPLVAFLAASSAAACGGGEGVKIGAVLPMSGTTATFGEECYNGMVLAAEEINAKTGEGPKLNLILKDDKGDSNETSKLVEQLAVIDGVSAIVGSVASTNSIKGGKTAQELQVPMMSPASTNVDVTKGRDFVSRLCFIDPLQGSVLAKLSLGDLGKKRAVVIIDRASDFSVGLAASFRATFTAGGGVIAGEESFTAGESDFSALITKVVAAAPDVIFIPAYYAEIGAMLRQAGDKWNQIPVVSGDGLDSPDLFKLMGNYTGPVYMSTHFAPTDTDPRVQDFVKKYTTKFGKTPGSMAALGYDSAYFMWDAVKRAGSDDRKAIRDAIAATKAFPAVTGNITLDGDRNAIKDVVILKMGKGDWLFHSRIPAQ
jgi:branched-chain amino acid transport system substrate-binding protein